MAGDVDEGESAARRQRRPGEPQVDGEAPRLLLGETVGVHARQGQDQGRLPVVDVAGSGDDVHSAGAGAGGSQADQRLGQHRVVGRIHGAQVADRAAVVDPGHDRRVVGPQGGGVVAVEATPADGRSCPGSEPPPATATVSHGVPTPSASARPARRRPTGPPCARRGGVPVAAQIRERRSCRAASTSPPGRSARPSGWRARRPPRRPDRRSPRPGARRAACRRRKSPRGAGGQCLAGRRLPRQPAGGRRPATGWPRRAGPTDVGHDRRPQGRQPGHVDRLGEADDPVVRLVDLQHQGDVVVHPRPRPGSRPAGCGWWCRPRPGGRPTGPSPRGRGTRRRSRRAPPGTRRHARSRARAASTSSRAAAPLFTTRAASAPRPGPAGRRRGRGGSPPARRQVELQVGVAAGAGGQRTGAERRPAQVGVEQHAGGVDHRPQQGGGHPLRPRPGRSRIPGGDGGTGGVDQQRVGQPDIRQLTGQGVDRRGVGRRRIGAPHKGEETGDHATGAAARTATLRR